MKRIILGLLFDGKDFYLSRNFRLQRLGDMSWLRTNFQIFDLASQVDEIAIFHVARTEVSPDFSRSLAELAEGLFVPISVGGGIRSLEDADSLFQAGADRVMFSNGLVRNPQLVNEIADKYGRQAVIGVINFFHSESDEILVRRGAAGKIVTEKLDDLPLKQMTAAVGELVLQSVDRDGSGQGFPVTSLSRFGDLQSLPWVATGGFGSLDHVSEVLMDARVQAVLTSNLLAFVGDGLMRARRSALDRGVTLAKWESFPAGTTSSS